MKARVLPLPVLFLAASPVAAQCYHLEAQAGVVVDEVLEAGDVADLTGDGVPDLAVPMLSGDAVLLLQGGGDGTFTTLGAVQLVAGTQPSIVSACDTDLDGDVDLVVGSEAGASVWILENDGTGAFPPPYQVVTGIAPAGLACADVDLDVDDDVVVTDRTSDQVRVLRNDGTGSFTLLAQGFAVLGTDPTGLACNDFNSDGVPDAMTASSASGTVDYLLNDGTGSFFSLQAYPAPLGARTLVGADLDGDGDTDAVTGDAGVSVVVNDGSGFFEVVAYTGTSGPAVAVADLDADGASEVLFGKPGGLGGLVGTPPAYSVVSPLFAGPGPDHLAVADLDGDMDDDLVVTRAGLPGSVQGLLSEDTSPAVSLSGCGANPVGSAAVIGDPYVGTVVLFQVDNPLGTQTPGSLPLVGVATQPDPAWPCGTSMPGWGMASVGAPGVLHLSLEPGSLQLVATGPAWQGPGLPSSVPIAIPANCAYVGEKVYAQGALVDATGPIFIGLTDAAELILGAF